MYVYIIIYICVYLTSIELQDQHYMTWCVFGQNHIFFVAIERHQTRESLAMSQNWATQISMSDPLQNM